MTVQCMQSRVINKREHAVLEEKVLEHLSTYINRFDYQNGNYGEFIYNVATILLNQLGLVSQSGFLFAKLLGCAGASQLDECKLVQLSPFRLYAVDKEVKMRAAFNL